MSDISRRAAIFGCAGLALSKDEIAFFKEVQPWGFILFARNCETPDQIKALCTALRDISEDEKTPILIDQEGGRVARLKPPLWPDRPPMDRFGALYDKNAETGLQAAKLGARLLANDLKELGVNVNCVPVLDVPQPGAHDIIGDRALSTEPEKIAALGEAVIKGCLQGGVLPIIKHIPGHGRALADSHLELPKVTAGTDELARIDFLPFKKLSSAPMAMTAHIVYEAIDKNQPATLSRKVIENVIRDHIGFEGLLMTDDLSMKALSGSFAERSQRAIEAGCDMLLHCNGDMSEMTQIAQVAPILEGVAKTRASQVRDCVVEPKIIDLAEAEDRFAELLKPVMA